MAKIKTYVGSDGKLHFVNSGGADSVLPFSSGIDISKLKIVDSGFTYNSSSSNPSHSYTVNKHCDLVILRSYRTPSISSGTVGSQINSGFVYVYFNVSSGTKFLCPGSYAEVYAFIALSV